MLQLKIAIIAVELLLLSFPTQELRRHQLVERRDWPREFCVHRSVRYWRVRGTHEWLDANGVSLDNVYAAEQRAVTSDTETKYEGVARR